MIAAALLVMFVTAAQDCGSWPDCRDQALAAAAAQEYERSHDLAWRAVQRGPRNDPALMTMLARAQSLSGRPHDALVMLQRLAGLGVVTDAATSEDFRRVRALPGWAEFEARLAGVETTPLEPEKAPESAATPVKPDARRTGDPAKPAPAPPGNADPPAARRREGANPSKAAPDVVVVGDAADMLRFRADRFTPAGLVYDSVSSRFIVAHRRDRKLSVIGERSSRVSNLIGAESGGFGEIGAVALDARRGDLWVASTHRDKGAMLHKLQLISGRLLFTEALAPGMPPARFGDLGVTPDGAVLALDTLGRRLFRFNGTGLTGESPKPVLTLPHAGTSLAPASETHAYVAHAEGISLIDLQSGSARAVEAPTGVSLGGFSWIRAHNGGLVAIRQGDGGKFQILRLRLNSSFARVMRVEVLERDVEFASPEAAVITRDVMYYLAPDGDSGFRVRRITLR